MLNEYERAKGETPGPHHLALMSESDDQKPQSQFNANDQQGQNFNKMVALMMLSTEIHSKINEKTLEILFFKYFIGDLSIKKIVYELYNKTV